jgi:hypothetical protein
LSRTAVPRARSSDREADLHFEEESGLLGKLAFITPMETGWIPKIDAGASISRWDLITSFNYSGFLQQGREARITSALNSLDRAQKIPRRERRRILRLWECLPSDDEVLNR